MTNRRLITLFVLALIGYGGLFFLFRRANPGAQWEFGMDRAEMIERVKATASSYGYTEPVKYATVEIEYDHGDEYYYNSWQSSPMFDGLVTPLKAEVSLIGVKSGSDFQARLNARGELLGYRLLEDAGKKDGEKKPPSPEALANDRKIADEALKRFLGERYGKFSFVSDSGSDKGRKFDWTASDDGLIVLAEAVVHDGKVRGIWLSSSLTLKLQAEHNARRGGAIHALPSLINLLIFPEIILMIIVYFVSLARRRIDHRKTLVFLACCFLLLFISNMFGGLADNLRFNFNSTSGGVIYDGGGAFFWLALIITNLCLTVFLCMFMATGLALTNSMYGLANRRTLDLELLLKGKLLRRPLTGSLVAGLLSGALLDTITHAVAATGIFAGASINIDDIEDLFGVSAPALSAFTNGGQILIFISFAFLIPAAETFVKKPLFRSILVFVISFMTMTGLETFYTSTPAIIVTSLLQAWLLVWLYRNFGLLAVIAAIMASRAALSSATLMAQSSASLQASGRHAAVGLVVAIIAALVGLWKSTEPKEEEMAAKEPPENRAERERLQGEFGVARKAQLRMLPEAPPSAPGIDISAVCNPSKEVGGDLYDFLALPEGKIGVVIADVSGKGVPASLYMTLTKGLLDSVAEYKTDPGEILREVNLHLYDVCRRKTFVTMFLGVIDPLRRTLSFARAGHNPTIICRNGASEPRPLRTWMLKSPGMGMGLNKGKIFNQSLKVETIQLEPGDKLFFYSDGITEAMNEKRDEYGEDRLMAIAERTTEMSAEQSRDAVMADVTQFLGNVHPQDDQTLVVLQIL
ncbi:MAG TPA: PP2C family protein-serine/threonine phosphatase [Blastocatellia bacterium]|nr:PP2C family protein-serine/threonine phosphatase [Blastocatellia bacterium]